MPDVGPVTAAAILAWRDEHGGFTSVDELLEVDGIGDATLAQTRAVRDALSRRRACEPAPTFGCRCSRRRAGRAGMPVPGWPGAGGAVLRRRRCSARRGSRSPRSAAGAVGSRRRRGRCAPRWRAGRRARCARRRCVRVDGVARDPVAALAAEHAAVRSTVTVPATRGLWPGVRRPGGAPATVREVAGGVRAYRCGAPVLVLGGAGWPGVPAGRPVATPGGSSRPTPPTWPRARRPAATRRCADARALVARRRRRSAAAIRDAVAHRPADQRALVPALVDGDDAGLDPALAEDFRTTGLTHLTAVSGTNLTLLVGFLLVLGALVRGARPRGSTVVGARRDRRVRAAGAHRAERAAGRGDGHGRRWSRSAPTAAARRPRRWASPSWCCCSSTRRWPRQPGSRCRCSPPPGSCCSPRRGATRWRGGCRGGWPRRSRCRPRPSSPARRSSRRSPARSAWWPSPPTCWPPPPSARPRCSGSSPALVGLVWGGRRGCSARWRAGASPGSCRSPSAAPTLPVAALDWGTGPVALGAAHRLCVRVAARRRGCSAPGRRRGGSVLLVRRAWCGRRRPGWPPRRLGARGLRRRPGRRAGRCTPAPGAGVVVDAGPDPTAVDRCLAGSGCVEVPLLVLTHFHADHVDGLRGRARRAAGRRRSWSPRSPTRRGRREVDARPPRAGRGAGPAGAVRRDPDRR